jgi:hypothetical protein
MLSPWDSLEPYWFSRSRSRSNFYHVTSFNGFWPNLVHKRIWNPIDFQGQRSRSPGQNFRRGDTSCFVLPLFLAHLAFRPCELLSSLFVRRPSVNISHFNLLLRNHCTNCNQSLVEWSLDGPLSKLCPVILTSNQDGHQAKNRKKGGWNFNCPLLL